MKLELKNLTKKYGNFTALDNMTITFEPGIYGILGANGAGKSTMMNLLTDNIDRTEGKILFDDNSVKGGVDILKLGKDFRKALGYMPQQQSFYEHMTAQTFLYYMAELKAIPKKQAKSEIEKLLSVTNLSEVRHKKLGGFSGGMKQRALLCQALLGNPKVVILDEPTAGLEPKERLETLLKNEENPGDDAKAAYAAVNTLPAQTKYLSDYPDWLNSIQKNKNSMLSFSIFSNPDSFSGRNILKTAEKFRICALQEVTNKEIKKKQPCGYFSGAVLIKADLSHVYNGTTIQL